MSLASEIIQDAFDSIGRGSSILPTDATLTARGLLTLISILEELRINSIILAETVDGTTTTVATPTVASSELNEPKASRLHLVNFLAIHLAAAARAKPEDMQLLPPASYSREALTRMYRVHVTPNKVPSKTLPLGQGASRGRGQSTFFNGQALDNDSTST